MDMSAQFHWEMNVLPVTLERGSWREAHTPAACLIATSRGVRKAVPQYSVLSTQYYSVLKYQIQQG